MSGNREEESPPRHERCLYGAMILIFRLCSLPLAAVFPDRPLALQFYSSSRRNTFLRGITNRLSQNTFVDRIETAKHRESRRLEAVSRLQTAQRLANDKSTSAPHRLSGVSGLGERGVGAGPWLSLSRYICTRKCSYSWVAKRVSAGFASRRWPVRAGRLAGQLARAGSVLARNQSNPVQ